MLAALALLFLIVFCSAKLLSHVKWHQVAALKDTTQSITDTYGMYLSVTPATFIVWLGDGERKYVKGLAD